jgi:hypothetical protein
MGKDVMTRKTAKIRLVRILVLRDILSSSQVYSGICPESEEMLRREWNASPHGL